MTNPSIYQSYRKIKQYCGVQASQFGEDGDIGWCDKYPDKVQVAD